jgi:hypothetical protein
LSQREGIGSWWDQHKHFFFNFFELDENLSWHLQFNIDTYTTSPGTIVVTDPGFIESNRRPCQ